MRELGSSGGVSRTIGIKVGLIGAGSSDRLSMRAVTSNLNYTSSFLVEF